MTLGFWAAGCSGALPANAALSVQPFVASAEFNKYWNSGLAELARFDLTQARYGSLHQGEMIVVVVAEPFRTDKQVKSEISPGTSDTAVLKTQVMRRFATGIYDYALTTTSFKPLDTAAFPLSLKVSSSAVDWCGHAWLQINLKGDSYRVQGRSYFEEFADEDFPLTAVISEDELWQRIRMNPATLPTGNIRMIPSLIASRLRHRRPAAEPAKAELKKTEYSIVFAEGQADERRVSFSFESSFPYRVLEYRETYLDGFQKKQMLTTVARLKKTVRSAYWREHDPEHLKQRREFGVKGFM